MPDPLPKFAKVDPQNPEAFAQCDRCGFCVYMAKNKITGHCYIGSTKHFGDRKRSHIRDALKGRNGCPYFYRALRKYGIEMFEWGILAEASTAEEIRHIESYWIRKLKPRYNIIPNGYTGNSGKFSKAGLKKIAKISRGNKYRLGMTHTRETRLVLRQCMLDNPGHWLKYVKLGSKSLQRPMINTANGQIFANRREASIKLSVPRSRIMRILDGTYSDLCSLPLRYLTEEECLENGFRYNPPSIWSDERRINFKSKKQYQCKPIICLDDGLSFPSLEKAALYYELEANPKSINNAHEALKQGWRWKGKRWAYKDIEHA